MVDFIIFGFIDRYLWGIATAVFFLCAIIYISGRFEMEELIEKRMIISFAFLFLSLAITRIFYLLSDLFVQGTYIKHSFYGNYDDHYPPFEILIKCGYITFLIGFSIYFLEFEIKKVIKYLLIILNIYSIILIIIFPFNSSQNVAYALAFLNGFIISIIMISFIIRPQSKSRTFFLSLSIGFLIIAIGHGLDSSYIKEFNIFPQIIPPILCITGSFIATFPLLITFRSKSASSVYPIKTEDSKTMFIEGLSKSKPTQISKEDISFYREQTICLTCKKQIKGFTAIFICTKCKALYCLKCARTLSNLENACWGCNEPIDPSKATKPYKMLEKEENFETFGINEIEQSNEKLTPKKK